MSTLEDIYARLLGQRYQEKLFSNLGPPKKAGDETLRKCPFCSKEGKFSYTSRKPVWHCWSCDEKGSWIDYLQKIGKTGDFREALGLLAQEAGVELPAYDQTKYQSQAKRADILEEAQEFCIRVLGGSEEERYLTARGYTPAELQGMKLGSFRDRDALTDRLRKKGFSEQEIRDSGVLTAGFGETHTVSFLWHDRAGRATGLVCRSTLGPDELKEKDVPKYKYSFGLRKGDSLLGLESLGTDTAVLVEGVLDTLYLNFLGMNRRIVSPGGTLLSRAHIEALEKAGVKRLLLALDMDTVGQEAVEKNIGLLRGSSIRPFVVTLPAGFKDPDQLVRTQGLPAFEEVLEDPQEWSFWLAQRIVSRHKETALGRDRAITEALEVHSGIEDPLDRRTFEDVIKEELSLSDDDISLRKADLEAEAAKNRAERQAQKLIEALKGRLEVGDLSGLEEAAASGLEDLRQARGVRPLDPYLIEDWTREITAFTGGLLTGYNMLDQYIRIPEGALSIIAGRPSHGKTSVMLNFLLRLVELYPEQKFYFYSYEENRAKILLKVFIILSGKVLHKEQNVNAYINYLKEKRGQDSKLEGAFSKLGELLRSGRLTVSDRHDTAEDLSSIIAQTCRKETPGAFFVDYIQKVPLSTPAGGGQRYLDIKRVSELLLEKAVRHNVPIILGAQLGRDSGNQGDRKVRLDNIRESGDIEQDAALALGLWNESVTQMEEQGGITPPEVPLELRLLKYRDSAPGRKFTLTFEGPILTLKDKAPKGLIS